MTTSNNSTTQIRVLVVGPLSETPSGERHIIAPGEFNSWLEDQKLNCSVTLPGVADDGTTWSLPVTKLRSLTLAQVVGAVEPLARLLALSRNVKDVEGTLSEVEAIVGPGPLLDEIRSALPSTESPPPPEEGDVFEQAEVPKESAPAVQAVSAFVAKGRNGRTSTGKSKPARKLRDAIESALYGAARAVLASPEVAALEEGLRGLHLLAQHCTRASGIHLEVVDVPLSEVSAALENRDRGDWVDEPDIVFVPGTTNDLALLKELAETAEEMMCPLVIGVEPSFVAEGDLAQVADTLEKIKPEKLDTAWLALRQEESSRWLVGVVNPVVLWAEGSGSGARTVFGSPVWAVAAILAQGYKEGGCFAGMTGKAGALSAPGVHTLQGGERGGTAVPTEHFLAIRHQKLMAVHGLLALGSARQSDEVILAHTPTMRAARDALPLGAQLLSGRVVRFALWVRDQVPPEATSETVNAMFQDASAVFLFPGMQEIGRVGATIVEKDGKKSLAVEAKVHHSYAGIPFEIAFPLPLD